MMVIERDASSTLLVLQIDHSRVAGLLAAHWGNSIFAEPAPFASMVLAATEHDSGWSAWESRPTIAADGSLLDYRDLDYWDWDGTVRTRRTSSGAVPDADSSDLAEVWLDSVRTVVDRLSLQDPYAAYLVSAHGVGLILQGFGLLPRLPDNSWSARVQQFAAEQERIRVELVEELRASPASRDFADDATLWTNYKLLEIFDQCAQFICNRYPLDSTVVRPGPPSVLGNVPVRPGVDDVELHIEPVDERTAVIDPYPFDVDPLPVSFSGRVIPRRTYPSQESFLRDYYKAERFPVNYLVRSRVG